MRTIEIVIGPTGETQLQTKGFAGRGCLEAARFLESALGRSVSDKLTPEFYAVARDFQSEQLSLGHDGG